MDLIIIILQHNILSIHPKSVHFSPHPLPPHSLILFISVSSLVHSRAPPWPALALTPTDCLPPHVRSCSFSAYVHGSISLRLKASLHEGPQGPYYLPTLVSSHFPLAHTSHCFSSPPHLSCPGPLLPAWSSLLPDRCMLYILYLFGSKVTWG
jgi:hypothetical protein